MQIQPATTQYKGTATNETVNYFFSYSPIETYDELSAKAIFVGILKQQNQTERAISMMKIRIEVIPNLNTREY